MKVIKQNIPKEVILNDIINVKEGHEYDVFLNHDYQTNQEHKASSSVLIKFVDGGRNTPEHKPGLTDSDLLYILIDRAIHFMNQFGDVDNSGERINCLKRALQITEEKTLKRANDGTLGNSGGLYE